METELHDPTDTSAGRSPRTAGVSYAVSNDAGIKVQELDVCVLALILWSLRPRAVNISAALSTNPDEVAPPACLQDDAKNIERASAKWENELPVCHICGLPFVGEEICDVCYEKHFTREGHSESEGEVVPMPAARPYKPKKRWKQNRGVGARR